MKKKIECKQSFFFTLYHVSCIKCTCILIKKNQETLFIVSGEQIWTKRRNERQRFFLLYNNNTTPRSSTKSYNKTVQGWFLPVCFSPAILHMITLKTLISQESWSPQYLKNLNLVLVTSQAIFHVFILLGFFASFLFMLG